MPGLGLVLLASPYSARADFAVEVLGHEMEESSSRVLQSVLDVLASKLLSSLSIGEHLTVFNVITFLKVPLHFSLERAVKGV